MLRELKTARKIVNLLKTMANWGRCMEFNGVVGLLTEKE